MKLPLCAALMAAALNGFAQANPPAEVTSAAHAAPRSSARQAAYVDFTPELEAATEALREKFDESQTNAVDFADNLAAINGLIAEYFPHGDREEVARLYLLEAHIYADGLNDQVRARAIWGQVVRDFPGTLAAKGAAISLRQLTAELAAEPDPNIPEGLEPGAKFPDFEALDFEGLPLSIAAHRGHVTLVDFWASWAAPSQAEMTNVVAAYHQYHAQGLDIIGVNMDTNHDAVLKILRQRQIVWPQFFDGKGWENSLAMKYRVRRLPMNYLLDPHGIIIAKGLRGNALPEAVYKALNPPGN